MSAWRVVYHGWKPAQEGLREALCTLGNGAFATRGASPEARSDGTHHPGTYLACGYDRARTAIGGRDIENEDLVNLPNWLPLTFRVVDEDDWFSLDTVEILDYRQELNLRDGLLARELRFRDARGRTTRWTERRLVSMAQPHLAALRVELAPEDWRGRIEIRSGLDGSVVNDGVDRYRELEQRHLDVIEAGRVGDDRILLRSRTRQSRLEVVQVARTRALVSGEPAEADRRTDDRVGRIAEILSLEVGPESGVDVEKVVALHTSRDRAISEPGLAACDAAASAPGFDVLFEAHRRAWHRLWDRFDVEIELRGDADDADAQMKLRLHSFHLLQTVSPHSIDLDVGVPARGWHGEAYRGHVFWDELFILPVLSLRMPALTRALLRYRHRRLPEARRAAREAGHRGAMFPWQSGSDGREESQVLHLNPRSGRWIPDESRRQRHVGAAIAYNVWYYHQVTDDRDFLEREGAELMLEIARFWASIACYDEVLDRWEILGVMGPDEYHTAYPGRDEGGIDNNAYTNVMAAWVLERARELLEWLPDDRRRHLLDELELSDAEIEEWAEISSKLRICFHDGVISQFEGYEALEEFPWEEYREKVGDIQRLDRVLEAEGDTPNRYKASKQADVLMLFYLFSAPELSRMFERLGYAWDPDLIPRNVAYYLDRTSHGSTLSRVTHAWVLARSDRASSWRLFCDALDSDIEDIQGGTTPEGIHLGAMAGTVDLVHRCYAGLECRDDVLHLAPCLPRDLERIRFEIGYRRHRLRVEVTRPTLTIESRPGMAGPIAIAHRGRVSQLSPGESLCFRLLPAECGAREIHSSPARA